MFLAPVGLFVVESSAPSLQLASCLISSCLSQFSTVSARNSGGHLSRIVQSIVASACNINRVCLSGRCLLGGAWGRPRPSNTNDMFGVRLCVRRHLGSISSRQQAPDVMLPASAHDALVLALPPMAGQVVLDCNHTPYPADGGQYTLRSGQWFCEWCHTHVNGPTWGHLRSWTHAKNMFHNNI